MSRAFSTPQSERSLPLATILEFGKPLTWFAPVWAFGCGAIAGLSSGRSIDPLFLLLGLFLAGPLLCGASQAVNDWFDRHVDAVNEPTRPVPSGRLPGMAGLAIAVMWTLSGLAVAAALGPIVFLLALAGCALAWAYSAPPLRLKRSGWVGPAAVAISYEGLAWITGETIVAGAPSWQGLLLAALFSIGAHGIMTLNDFKAVNGDRHHGVRSLPVRYGTATAGRIACAVMAVPQIVLIALLWWWSSPISGLVVAALLLGQLVLMQKFVLRDPVSGAARYNATGTSLFVLNMLIAALAIGPLA